MKSKNCSLARFVIISTVKHSWWEVHSLTLHGYTCQCYRCCHVAKINIIYLGMRSLIVLVPFIISARTSWLIKCNIIVLQIFPILTYLPSFTRGRSVHHQKDQMDVHSVFHYILFNDYFAHWVFHRMSCFSTFEWLFFALDNALQPP